MKNLSEITILEKEILLNDGYLKFFHPENDDTFMGTLAVLQKDLFHIKELRFEDKDIILDIGSNIGLMSLVLAKLWPETQIYCFDASEIAIHCLRKSISANRINNINVFNLAVGAKEGVLSFASNNKEVSCLIQKDLSAQEHIDDYVVKMVSIDSIFDLCISGDQRCAFLKMDIEGGEFGIFDRLFSSRRDLLLKINKLHLEIHDVYGAQKSSHLKERVLDYFKNRVCFDA